jgi:DNA polymerase-3 subunit delta
MGLSKDKLRTEIEAGKFRPVYVLHGEETCLRDNAAKFITREAFSEDDFRDFNDDSFSLSTPENISVALSAANQLPMMASRRIVRITDVRVSTSAIKDTLKEEAEEELKAYIADPNPSTILIFIADELNGSRKLGKLLKSHDASVEFQFPDNAETRRLAEGVFKKSGVTIEPPAMNRLIELVGFDARRITTESEKLATAALPGRTIDKNLVDSLVRNSREISNFDFARDLISGRRTEAVTALEKALSDGEEPLALLGLMAWQFRDELKKTSSARSGYSERLAYALERIADTDLAIKTSVGGSGKQSRKQLEMLVCELASN